VCGVLTWLPSSCSSSSGTDILPGGHGANLMLVKMVDMVEASGMNGMEAAETGRLILNISNDTALALWAMTHGNAGCSFVFRVSDRRTGMMR
jgi:hypothetical protein